MCGRVPCLILETGNGVREEISLARRPQSTRRSGPAACALGGCRAHVPRHRPPTALNICGQPLPCRRRRRNRESRALERYRERIRGSWRSGEAMIDISPGFHRGCEEEPLRVWPSPVQLCDANGERLDSSPGWRDAMGTLCEGRHIVFGMVCESCMFTGGTLEKVLILQHILLVGWLQRENSRSCTSACSFQKIGVA